MALQHLPIETLEQIFSQGVLTHADLVSLSRVCKYFNEILGQDYVWRIQNSKTWPMCKHMDSEMTAKEFSQHRLQFAWKIRNVLKAMGPAYYSQEYVSELDMAEVDQFIDNVNLGQEMVVEELEQIYKDSGNLTTQHYCQMLLLWRRRFAEMDWWVERSESESDDDNLEEIAWRVCRWAKCCPPLSFVTEKLDMMAECIAEKLPFKQRENLSTSQTYSVFTAVRDHMFKVEGFHLKRGSDGEENRQGLMITDVLTSQGSSPYVLSIIFKALAKRLGVTCQIMNKERKDLVGVRWEEFPFRDVSHRWTYLDIGDITEDTIVKLPAAEPHDALVNSSQVTHILLTELAGAMVGTADHANLIHVLNLLSKLTLIPQEGHQYLNSLKSRHQGHEHNTVDGQEDCYSTNRAKFELANNQKRRKEDSEVEYSSGMIMRHKRYNYLCVIRGWDETCEASLDWIWQMGVHNLNKKQFQPFYHVLVNDNTQRYAAQESLEIAVESPEVDHHQLGKYFTQFAGTHYKLNEESEWVYPEDQELTAIIMEKFVARVLREKNKTLSYFS